MLYSKIADLKKSVKVDMAKRTKPVEFYEFLGTLKGRRCFVAVLGSPDPDGMASAWAVSMIARSLGIDLPIFGFEVISRPDNMEFLRLLKVPMTMVRDPEILQGYDGFIAVDRQNPWLPKDVKNPPPLLGHIDHHQKSPTGAVFSDVRQNVGSTSTILTQYLEDLKEHLDTNADAFRRLCTALMVGIRTDTDGLLRANSQDFSAAAFLARHTDTDFMYGIMKKPVGERFLDSLRSVLNTMKRTPYLCVAYAGQVAREARDTLGQCTDFLLHSEGVRTVVVFGLIDGDVVGSMRTMDPALDPYPFLVSAFQKHLSTELNAGGRRFAGGFQFEIENLFDAPDVSEEEIYQKVFDILLTRAHRRYVMQKSRSRS